MHTRNEIMAMDAEELRRETAKALGFIPFDETRCPVCGWTYSSDASKGCVPGDCSMRPSPRVRADEDYSNWPEDIAAAWTLVDEMGNSGTGLPDLCFKSGYIAAERGRTAWVFEFRLFAAGVYKYGVHELIGVGETPMLAISRAWLLWKEGQK